MRFNQPALMEELKYDSPDEIAKFQFIKTESWDSNTLILCYKNEDKSPLQRLSQTESEC